MQTNDILNLPIKPQTREASLNIRLTPNERAAIDGLAKRMNVTPSHFARHFLMQIVKHYASKGNGSDSAA